MPYQLNKYLGLVLLTILASCKDTVPDFQLVEVDPKVTIHFRMMNQGAPVAMNKEFVDVANFKLELVDLAFYISNVELRKANNQVEQLNDVLLVDFTELNSEGEYKDFTRSYSFIIEPGDYKSLKFDLGLPSNLNASDPTTFSNDDPLRGTEMYWSWATKYRFIRFGATLIENNGEPMDFDMQIHTGLDTMFMPDLVYETTYKAMAFASDTLFVDIDWNKIFHPGTEMDIDLATKIFTHGTETKEERDLCFKFTKNFADAISVSAQ